MFKINKEKVVKLLYKNYKGVTKLRTVQPIEIWYGSTEYHKGAQWLMKVYDLDKEDYRDYALNDIKEWGVKE
ncbi:hypothetical protein GF389_04770 [Candidatus Dojkabacteria bacterium]|nr:hypothetical protein [Candidatus Dojkabacteria bacterium]